MKVFLVPEMTGDREWKLDDFHKNEKWKGLLSQDQLQALDYLPPGGELDFDNMIGRSYKIMRIL